MTELLGQRVFLKSQVPFLIGRHYQRPAPTHVINGLLADVFGLGPSATFIRDLIEAEEAPANIPGVASGITSNPEKLQALRTAAALVFDPDAKVFPSRGSPFPIHPGAVSRDSSDDGLGSSAWSLLNAYRHDAADLLHELFTTPQVNDGVSAFAHVLCSGYGGGQELTGRSRAEFKLPGRLGSRFGKALCELVLRPVRSDQHFTRSLKIAAVTRGTFAAVFLATLRTAEFVAKAPASWKDLAPLFALGAVPPGRNNSPEVRLAIRSFERVVAEHRAALQKVLTDRLPSKRLDVPARQYPRVLLSSAFQLEKPVLQEAVRVVGDVQRRPDIARRLLTAIYPPGHLESGFRSLGIKIGIAGPDRGTGSARVLFETPVLALLVDATLGDEASLPYAQWLDRLFEAYGLICGRGEKHDYEELLSPLGARGPIALALDANHEALRRRLIRAGLAVEYSDAETEVIRPTT